MRIRSLLIPIFIIASFWCDTSFAYKIHAEADTVFVHAKRGSTGQPGNLVIMSSRRGEDTATFYKQGWDTIRVSLSAGSEFAWGASWETAPIPFLGDRILYLEYTPTSLDRSTAIVTVIGDSNTIQIVIIGIPDTNFTCLRVSGTQAPSIPEGGSGLATDTIYNLTSSDAIIDSVILTYGDTSAFAIQSPTFPQTIPQHSALAVTFQSTIPSPAINQSYSRGFTIFDHGTSSDGAMCATSGGYASASLLVPWDTLLIELPPSASDTLTLSVHAAITNHVLLIQNSSSSRIYLTTAGITNSNNIAAFQYPDYGPHCKNHQFNQKSFCFDDTLINGAWSDTARFTMQVSDSGTYDIDLLVNYADALQSQNYTIRAHYIEPAKSDVSMPLSVPLADFSLNPNPASGEVTISLTLEANSTIEIYDVLGNLVFSKQSNGSFIWNGQSSAGKIAPDGVYIVRVLEARASGQVTTASKRLMLMR